MFDTIKSTADAFTQMRIGTWCNLGHTLLVGEGNLSFAKSLLRAPMSNITSMAATTFEPEKNLTPETKHNAHALRTSGALVLHGVNATHLKRSLKPFQFETIIFQFPNVGSHDPKYGQNPNHIMLRNFLRCASNYLSEGGKVLITSVDSPHYEGVFKFDEAADFAGYEITQTHPFDPTLFSGYSHVNTNDKNSALNDHSKFTT